MGHHRKLLEGGKKTPNSQARKAQRETEQVAGEKGDVHMGVAEA